MGVIDRIWTTAGASLQSTRSALPSEGPEPKWVFTTSDDVSATPTVIVMRLLS